MAKHSFKNQISLTIIFFIAITSIKTAEYNAHCETSDQCHEIYTKSYSCVDQHCLRDSFKFNTWQEWVGAVVIVIISMLANAGGLGAGAVIIPVYIFIYDFAPTDSIPLSKITIFAGAIASVMLTACQRRADDKNKLIINYEMAAAIVPLLLIGTMVGVLASKTLPPVAITGCLCLYLVYSTYKMCQKAIEITKKENAARAEENSAKELVESASDLNETTLEDTAKKQFLSNEPEIERKDLKVNQKGEPKTVNIAEKDTDLDVLDRGLYDIKDVTCCEHLKNQLPNLGLLLLSFMVVQIVALLRGGHGTASLIGISACGAASWSLFAGGQLLGVLIAAGGYMLNKKSFDREDNGDADKKLLRKKLLMMAYFTGIAAGALGIGGGMILGPFMLALGMDPGLSTALSGFTVLFTSSSTTSQFIIAGAIHLEHASWFMLFSLIGSFIGNLVLKRMIKYYNRPSLIIWVIFSIQCLACCVLPPQSIYNAFTKKSALAFTNPCEG